MGRRAKPTHLKIVTGNPGKRPLNKHEPKVEPGIPDPPSQLSARALEEWNRLAVPLYNLGVMTRYDRAVFALYCQSWGRWQDNEEIVAVKGAIVRTQAGNIIQNPALGIANVAARDCIKYAIELGLTPSARSRIDTEGLNARAAQAIPDEYEEFFGSDPA